MTEGLSRRHFTVADIEAMVAAGVIDEDERIELIAGELVPMSPKGSRHESIKIELFDRWIRARPDGYRLAPETTFRLSDDTYLEPDIVIYESTGGVAGLASNTVLLVVEIADSSLRYDTGRKAAVYASFGVRELWVIDAVASKIRVFRDPAPDGYRSTKTVTANAVAAPLVAPSAFSLRLADLDIENDTNPRGKILPCRPMPSRPRGS